MNAVAMSQGMSAAFSTGSHAQYPPQPRTTYDHFAPNHNPMLRQYQAHIIHRRARSTPPSAAEGPAARAAMTIEKGTVRPTYPKYSVGGWIAIQGFNSSGFMPRPSSGANGTVANGDATAVNISRKNAATAAKTTITPGSSSGCARPTARTAASV